MSSLVRNHPLAIWFVMVWAMFASAQDKADVQRDHEFQLAVQLYDSQHYKEAIGRLEELERETPEDFQVQELLGTSYAATSLELKALVHLQLAIRLNPQSGVAHTNLATTLSRLGRSRVAGDEFLKAYELEPDSYATNHNLGEFYVAAGKLTDGRSFLKRAQQLKPTAYGNGYDLALADLITGQLDDGRQTVQALLQEKDTGELHNLLAQIDERERNFVSAANEYEIAAHMDPTEDNLFDWGGELLMHRTYEPAIEVFRAGSQRYPHSPRMLIGLGVALYARGLYEDAIKSLLAAADLDPTDERCYLFLAKEYQSSPAQADEVILRFKRYAQLEPNNAMAQYYYAMSLWKGRQVNPSSLRTTKIKLLLERSIALDESIAESHMQLGNMFSEQHQYKQSIPEYIRALQLDADLPEAHYRLGTDYVHMGQKDRARFEFATYQKLRAKHQSDSDKEGDMLQQFVYSSKATSKVEGNAAEH